MNATKAELRTWVERFRKADQASRLSDNHVSLSPDESFARALELMQIANEHGLPPADPHPSAEDMRVIQAWNRIRSLSGVSHAAFDERVNGVLGPEGSTST